MSKAWIFKNREGMELVGGKPRWPAMLRIEIENQRDAISLVQNILEQIEEESDHGPFQFVLVGDLARELEED